jgi:HD-GYP domain-containing protein (c-di-GMP phosphodiesterase class II)
VKHDIRSVDMGNAAESAAFLLRHLASGRPAAERVRTGIGFLAGGRHDVEQMLENHWRAADALMERLAMSPTVRHSVSQTFERWDGKGEPDGLRGDAILLPSRLVNLADVVEVFHQAGGTDAAISVARARSGTQFDPGLVELFTAEADALFAELEGVSSWDAVMATEPALDVELTEAELDVALEAVADFVDLKSPYTLGHSRGVADLAGDAATLASLPDATTVRRAALVHDLGRLGVSNAIWDKEGELTHGETERVRLHPYLTERMLASAPALAPLAALAVQHHERLDGSGYPRGLTADALGKSGRVLGAADLYQSKVEPRPHRPAGSSEDAAEVLRHEVRAGRLDGEAVDAVLRAAGHRVRRRREWPAGLTTREVEVLRLVARGRSHKEIAEELGISRKTASNHVEHIYTKIGVSNRAMASVFAMKHGLMHGAEPATDSLPA